MSMSTNEDVSAEAEKKRKGHKKSPKKPKGLSFLRKGAKYLKSGCRLIVWIFRDRLLDFIETIIDLFL
jgi:hypothetical protein